MLEIVELRVPRADAELAADRLWIAGAAGVEEVDVDARTVGLRAVLSGVVPDRVGVASRIGRLPPGWALTWVEVDDAPSEAWRDHAVPVEVGGPSGFVLRPAWTSPVADGRIEVEIEPGASFGLGDHPTTRLCAAAVRSLVRSGDRVLDVGCGSGVLGIVALMFGAASVRAIDVSAAAVDATRANADRNGVGDRLDVSLDPLDAVEGRYDLVVANILAPALIALRTDLVRVLDDDGVLVVSGLLADSDDHVVAALQPLRVLSRTTMSSWSAITLGR